MLSTIDDIIDKNEFDNLVLTGDINTDFIRKSGHVTSVKNFIDEKGLVNAKDQFEIDFTHVYNDNFRSHRWGSSLPGLRMLDPPLGPQ